MVDDFIHDLLPAISEARFDSYGEVHAPRDTKLLNYLRNIELSQAFYPLLQAYEVAFRNAIHGALSQFEDNDRWFDGATFLLDDQIEKIEQAKQALRARHKPLTTGRIVAQLTFGFWTSMLNRPYEASVWHNGKPIVLLSAFPYLPKHRRSRKSMYGRAQLANTLRNRIFHYEPIWNRPHLRSEHAKVLETLGWINPEMCRIVALYDTFESVYDHDGIHGSNGLWDQLNLI